MQKFSQTERVLKALANRRRLAILLYLKNSPNSTVGAISEHIRLSFKSTSRHLSVLFTAEIIQKEQRGLNVYYSLTLPSSIIVKSVLGNL